MYLDTGARPQLFNAIKYSTAFPVRADARPSVTVEFWCSMAAFGQPATLCTWQSAAKAEGGRQSCARRGAAPSRALDARPARAAA